MSSYGVIAAQHLESPYATRVTIKMIMSRQAGFQRAALGAASGPAENACPGPFLIGPAVLMLLTDHAEERPSLCVRRRPVARRVPARARLRRAPPAVGCVVVLFGLRGDAAGFASQASGWTTAR